ncbi:MAG: ABC transporter permease [Actinomycetaceae bacterium]|nr:ABC transporter permease [Actinomycetaceae bacterium]
MLISFMNALPGALAQGIIWGIMAIGVYLTFRLLDIPDLTVDGSFTTGGAVAVMSIINGTDPWVSLIYAFIAGCIAGFVTGVLHTKFGIPAILAGILTQLALFSINLRILGDKSNQGLNMRKYNLVVVLNDIQYTLIVASLFALVLIALLYWFFGTELGSSIRATGTNEAMAKANGINTNRNKIIGLALSNGIVALSGALYSQFNGNADVNSGRGAIVIGLAAVIIGEVLFSHFFNNFSLRLLGSVIGGMLYYTAITFVLALGLRTNDLKLFSAIVVALFLGAPYWKNKITIRRIGRKTTSLHAREGKEDA